MKRKILLIDDSITVQKVVSLTLDKQKYSIHYSKTRTETIKEIIENTPDLVLISDSFHDINWQTFPKEVEAWLSRNYDLPSMVLVTSQEISEAKHYSAILRKPFSPQVLLKLVEGMAPVDLEDRPTEIISNLDENKLQNRFNEAFDNEAKLIEKTFQQAYSHKNEGEAMSQTTSNLWASDEKNNSQILGASDSLAYKASLENKIERELESKDLDSIVDRVLNRVVPPIVERLVQERLDQLLREQERV